MSLFVETSKSDLYKLYRPKKSTRDAPRQWWRYSILATMYLLRHSQRADLWTVVSAKNMDILHNLRKALKLKSIMIDAVSLSAVFDDSEPMRRFENEMAILKKENELLRRIVAKAFTPNLINESGQSLDYCKIFSDDGSYVTVNLKDIFNPTDANIESRTVKSLTPSKPSTASGSSPIRHALTSAGLIVPTTTTSSSLSPEDSMNASTDLPSVLETSEDTFTVNTSSTSHNSPPQRGKTTAAPSTAPVSPYLDLSGHRTTSIKIYREEPEIMRSCKADKQTSQPSSSTSSSTAQPSSSSSSASRKTEISKSKRNATIMAKANEAMAIVEAANKESSPVKSTLPEDKSFTSPTTSNANAPSAVAVVTVEHSNDNDTVNTNLNSDDMSMRSGMSSKSKSKKSNNYRHSSAKVVPVNGSMLNKSEKVAFDIIVSAKKGVGSPNALKAAATIALTPVEIALMKSPLSKDVMPPSMSSPRGSPPKDSSTINKQPMMF